MSRTSDVTPDASAFPYVLRTFPSRLVDGQVPDAVAQWVRAVSLGFHGAGSTPEDVVKYVRCEEVDGRVMTGAYLTNRPTPAGAWGAEVPVATFASHRKTVNIGAGRLLPLHQITAVTVRPSHRRRGLLRAMMEADLTQAAAAGLPMAALTASEATIYGRFGFGVATQACAVTVTTKAGLGLVSPAAGRVGQVEIADPAVIADLHNTVFARVHATTVGSVDRQDMYRLSSSGQGSYESMDPVKGLRAALHYDDTGVVDGFVSYKPTEPSLEIVDLIAATNEAYLGLWAFLGSIDLIEEIKWSGAPEVDPLEWALVSRRDYQRTKTEDHLWLRILDTPAVLTQRPYGRDGALVLRVTDPLGHASGTFGLDIRHGVGTVTRLPEAATPDLVLGVSELSSLYLGGVSARTLAAAGRLRGATDSAVARFDALFAPDVAPHSWTDF